MRNLSRWLFILLTFASVRFADAQQPGKVYRIGILISASHSIASQRIQGFQQALRDLGYIEGKNMLIEYRYAEGKPERYSELAAELVSLKVDIVVTDTSFSNLTRVAFLTRQGTATGERRFQEAEFAAKGLGLRLQLLQAKGAEDLGSAFEAAKRSGVQAVLAHPSTFIVSNRARIVELAAKHRLPVIYHRTAFAEGGLMSYGPGTDIVDNYRRAAVYVDKILKGAKPADLPVQQPTKFDFVINLKTAKQIGLAIPPNVLARADRVIR